MATMIRRSGFAAYDEIGLMVALIAEGLPEWPDSLATVEDAALGTMEAAYLAELVAMDADEANADPTVYATLADHVVALRNEALTRMTAAPVADPPEPAPVIEPAPAAVDEDARAAAFAAARALLTPEPDPGATVEPSAGITREDLVAAVAAGAEAGARAVMPAVTAAITAATALPPSGTDPGRPVGARDLGRFHTPTAITPHQEPTRARARLVASVDAHINGQQISAGRTEITDIAMLRDMMIDRARDLGVAQGVSDEKVVLASAVVDWPEERDLRNLDWVEQRRKILAVCGPEAVGVDPFTGKEALIASGGLAAPVEPYYPQIVIAQGARPVQAALPTFVAERGGIRLVQPPTLATLLAATTTGLYADGVTATSTSLVSATAAFNAGDAGRPVVNAGTSTFIPAGTIIATVTNGTTVVLSQATTGTGSAQSFYLPGRNPNSLGPPVGLVTAAQDAAGPPNFPKYTYDVPIGTQVEFDVYSIYTSLQYANLTARTFPEQVEANIRLADALAARVGDTAMLDIMTNYSTLLTGAKTFGSARQLLGQIAHSAAFLRNTQRMDPRAVLHCGMPAWVIDNMRQDYLNSLIGGGQNWGLSDDEIGGWFEQERLMPFFYQDGPTDITQLFATSGITAATNTGANSATPMAIPDWPFTGSSSTFRNRVVSYLFPEGVWLGLTTGELVLGLVRDSILNSQNRFRSFQEEWETPAFVGGIGQTVRTVHSVFADGSFAAATTVALGVGSGL